MFISFDYDNDKFYKNLLVDWDKNGVFDFTFSDDFVNIPVNGTDAGLIRLVISEHISDCPIFLCIVGEQTHKNDWVTWQIDKAIELEKKIIAVKTDRSNTIPAGLDSSKTTWAFKFNFDSIKKAVEES